MTFNLTTMTTYQQQWAKEYETLKQIANANFSAVEKWREKQGNVGLTSNETKAFDQAKFNYLEAERQMRDFIEIKNIGIDNGIQVIDYQLAHASDLQLSAFEIDQRSQWKAGLNTEKPVKGVSDGMFSELSR